MPYLHELAPILNSENEAIRVFNLNTKQYALRQYKNAGSIRPVLRRQLQNENAIIGHVSGGGGGLGGTSSPRGPRFVVPPTWILNAPGGTLAGHGAGTYQMNVVAFVQTHQIDYDQGNNTHYLYDGFYLDLTVWHLDTRISTGGAAYLTSLNSDSAIRAPIAFDDASPYVVATQDPPKLIAREKGFPGEFVVISGKITFEIPSRSTNAGETYAHNAFAITLSASNDYPVVPEVIQALAQPVSILSTYAIIKLDDLPLVGDPATTRMGRHTLS